MAIQTLQDTGVANEIPSSYDGACYQINKPDCVVGGVGDNMTLNYQLDSLNVSFNAGSEAIIGGNFFKVESLTAITLSPNATIYLCATIDKSMPNNSRGFFAQRTASNMQSGNLNGSDNARDLLLYIITTSANGVTNVVDRRKIIGNSYFMSESEFEALQTKQPYAIYNIYED